MDESSKSSVNSGKSKKNINRLINNILLLFMFFSLIISILACFGQYFWGFELLSHFRFQYLIVQTVFLIYYSTRKSHVLIIAAISLILLLNSYITLGVYFSPKHEVKNVNCGLKVLFSNVYTSNRNFKALKDYISRMKPDIIGLVEINELWNEQLKPLEKEFKYHICKPRNDNFGIAFYSKIPPQRMTIEYFGKTGVPSICADINYKGKNITVIVTHPVPPWSSNMMDFRNDQLSSIVSRRDRYKDNIILLGDLNMTPWSYYFGEFINKMKLLDTRSGIQATWPVYNMFLYIPIDHCLVSNGFKIIKREVGSDIGSDHFPIFAEVVLD
ncbi:endonuclease/exonuclease/phosphatase family protein [bacterium]|nr:endonuclease/exonuclease/phosphatase family protein [bacterium]